MNVDQLFNGMANANINGSGTYMDEGLYVVETKSIFVKKGNNPAKPGDSFIAEFTVLKSNNEKHPIGSSGSYVLKFTNPYAMGNIVEFVMALLGYQNTKENQADATKRQEIDLVTRAACDSDSAKKTIDELRAGLGNPTYGVLTGVKVNLECRKKPTKAGGEFTVHKWAPIAA